MKKGRTWAKQFSQSFREGSSDKYVVEKPKKKTYGERLRNSAKEEAKKIRSRKKSAKGW